MNAKHAKVNQNFAPQSQQNNNPAPSKKGASSYVPQSYQQHSYQQQFYQQHSYQQSRSVHSYGQQPYEQAHRDFYMPGNGGMGSGFSGGFGGNEEAPVSDTRRKLKIAGIVLGIILAVLAVVYGAGVFYFSGHFLPHTTIYGEDVSLKTPDEVKSSLTASLEDYQLYVSGYGCEITLSGTEIEYGLDSSKDLLSYVNPWAWPVELFTQAGKNATFEVVYNESLVSEKLTKALAAHNSTATASADAYLSYNKESDSIVITPEVQGTQLNEEQVISDVHEALKAVVSTLELTDNDLIHPSVYSTDENMKKAAQQVNALSNVNVTLTLGGYEALTITKENVLDWIYYDENKNVSLNEEVIEQWAQEQAEKLDTYGNEHTYTRPDGKVITVSGGPDTGWEIDTGALKDTIVSAITNGEQGEIAIPCSNEGTYYNKETGAEWASYIDVDLAEQHAYYYDDNGNLLWESDIISGNVNISGRETPTGVYAITRKATNEKLYTYEEGKEKPNESTVAYWMPFIGNVYALHDAWWQPGFGGTMYKDGYGSHGCVNLPSSAAAELYDMVEVGTVVVVHW